ncbi:phosphopantetheine attachment site [Lucifera butyrica]|uniref:Phosphopantetheine attachment site n=1 Tax=Lucifera butyrica TaxID=1351585 RepID=A0A498R2I1_9FIRM|nr:non-ribosomal peptide synthetase [Lucifera butyrica]VBB05355.1 phosphopantetheine attachment site [Lucifera butyrica]
MRKISENILEPIFCHAQSRPKEAAILSPDQGEITYEKLVSMITATLELLRSAGVKLGDRTAVALKSGPEFGITALAVIGLGTCVPLNWRLTEDEIKKQIKFNGVKNVIVPYGQQTLAEQVGVKLGLNVIRLSSLPTVDRIGANFSKTEEVALLMNTSGTTDAPKTIPITHEMLCHSVQNTAAAFRLRTSDRCLNTAQLFNVHGFVIGFLVTLTSGGATILMPTFQPALFFELLEKYRPTWYTATPAVHHSVVDYFSSREHRPDTGSLRFIRSAAASCPVRLVEALEANFKVPFINAYGMTETSSQVTSIPFPPAKRKNGSVGISNGNEIRILGSDGKSQRAYMPGEIAVKGKTVFAGYENNAAANEAAFCDTWFKTGDEGYLDSEGYLFVTGRSKEIINKGGLKIYPSSIEDTVLRHPAVLDAAIFPIPHERMGEEIALAIVVKEGQELADRDIINFIASQVAYYEVPSAILRLDSIPRSPAGKIQRHKLNEVWLSRKCDVARVSPRNNVEQRIYEAWREILRKDTMSIFDDFFLTGGDSLSAASLAVSLSAEFETELFTSEIYRHRTIEQQATLLDSCEHIRESELVPLREAGNHPPLFVIHALDGDIIQYYKLIPYIDNNTPLYGIRYISCDKDRLNGRVDIRRIAQRYVRLIQNKQPKGPYLLLGWSLGGVLAYEISQQLRGQGQKVAFLGIVDSQYPGFCIQHSVWKRLSVHGKRLIRMDPLNAVGYIRGRIATLFDGKSPNLNNVDLMAARSLYVPQSYQGEAFLFQAKEQNQAPYYVTVGLEWENVVSKLKVVQVEGNHFSIWSECNVEKLSRSIMACLQEALDNSIKKNVSS